MSNVKATRWLDAKEYIVNTYGLEKEKRVMDELSGPDRAALSKIILPLTWLDYGAYLRYMFVADKLLGQGDNALIAESGRYTARKHFRGIYRFFISFTSPHYIIKRGAQVWRQYFDVGHLEATASKPNLGTLKLTDYPDIPLNHDLSHTPFMEEVLRLSGAKNPRGTHPKCMARKDDHCLWEFVWE